MSRRIQWGAAAIAACVLVTLALITIQGETRGRVVDSRGRPVSNAVVVASWSEFTGPHNFPVGPVKVLEVRTASDGSFYIPNWVAPARHAVRGPRLFAHAPSFRPTDESSQGSDGVHVIVLADPPDNPSKYLSELHSAAFRVSDLYRQSKPCLSREFPLLSKGLTAAKENVYREHPFLRNYVDGVQNALHHSCSGL